MSAPLVNCPCCDTQREPIECDNVNATGRNSVALWIACPSCEMAGPKTWITLDELADEREHELAKTEARDAWDLLANRASAGRMFGTGAGAHRSMTDRIVSLRGRAS